MYIPAWFREENILKLHDFIRQFSFAALVTQREGSPFATHLPFLLDRERGERGTLQAHMARANPQWQEFEAGQEALIIFQGPHAYISPAWYKTQPSVPTWNYAVVHAYGIPRIVDELTLRAIVEATVQTFESEREQPWNMDLPEEYLQKMLRGIVGFEIEITRLEGKFKMSQNRSEADRKQVIEALLASDHAGDRDTAHWMKKTIDE